MQEILDEDSTYGSTGPAGGDTVPAQPPAAPGGPDEGGDDVARGRTAGAVSGR